MRLLGLALALTLVGCGGGIERESLPAEPIAFIRQHASQGILSMDDLRAALRIENPDQRDTLKPRLVTTLSLLQAQTGEIRPVPNAGPGDQPLDWSPDGNRLLVGRVAGRGAALELYAWNRRTGSWSRLRDHLAAGGGALAGGPLRSVWSQPVRSGPTWVYRLMMRSDGRGTEPLPDGEHGILPDVSPDGRTVVFVRPNKRAGRESMIVMVDRDGREARVLGRGAQPRFSRDGRWIVFTRKRGENRDVYLMRGDGSAKRPITQTPSFDEEFPAVSADGRFVVYASARGPNEQSQIFVRRVEDGVEQQLTSGGQNSRPVW